MNRVFFIIFTSLILLIFGPTDANAVVIGAIAGAIVGGALVSAGILGVSFLGGAFAISGFGALGFLAGAAGGAIWGAVIGKVISAFTVDSPEEVGHDSNTYGGQFPVATVEQGIPIPIARGKLRIAGNIVRVNDPDETDYYKMIVAHCQGQSDTTVPMKSGTTLLAYYVNGVEWSRFINTGHKFWSHSGATAHQSGVSHLFTADVSNFRDLTLTEFKLKKGTEDVKGVNNINVVGRFGRCLEIGQAAGGVRSWTRNPAQVMWDWYISVEEYATTDLNEDAFEVLYDYCKYIPPDSDSVPIWPPGPSNLTVRATSRYSDYAGWEYEPFYAFDKNSPLIGVAGSAAWVSAAGSFSNQRINIDLGDTYFVDKVEIENYHNSGADINIGICNMYVYWSNDRDDFEDASWGGFGPQGGWISFGHSTGTVTQHPATNTSAPQTITLSQNPETPCRYLSVACESNWGNATYMGVRRIKFYGKSPRYTFDYNFDAQMTINDAKKMIWKSFNGMCVMNQGKIKPVWDAAENCYNDGMLLTKEDDDFLLLETGDNILLERSQTKTISHNFTIDNIVKDSFAWAKPRRPNIVRIYYINSQNGYKKDSVEIKDETDIEAKGELPYEETCWWITESDVARRRARFKFDKARYTDYTCRLVGFPDSSVLDILDRVTVSHPFPSWSGKGFLVTSKSEDNIGRPAFGLEAYYSGIYHDRGYEQQENYASKLPNPLAKISGVTGITLAEDAFFDPSGNWINKVILTYTPSQNPFYSHSRVWLKAGAVGDGVGYEAYGLDNSGGANFIINNVKGKFASGSTITVKVEAINQSGMGSGTCPVASVWASLPNINTEIAALTGDAKMILPNGAYDLTSGVTISDYNLDFKGASRGGVIIKNHAGDHGFILHNLTKTFKFSDFTIQSQNVAAFSSMIYVYGDTAPDNTSNLLLSKITSVLSDDGDVGGSGDKLIYGNKGDGKINISLVTGIGGEYPVRTSSYNRVFMNNSEFSEYTQAVLIESLIAGTSDNIFKDFLLNGLRQLKVAGDSVASITGNHFMAKDDNDATAVDMIGLEADALQLNVVGNNININNSRTAIGTLTGISVSFASKGSLSANIITLDNDFAQAAAGFLVRGIFAYTCLGYAIVGNTISMNIVPVTNNHYGIDLSAGGGGQKSDGNTVAGNTIDGVNNAAQDIGIRLDANSDNNSGDNNTRNVGTSISNGGVGNTVTATDS